MLARPVFARAVASPGAMATLAVTAWRTLDIVRVDRQRFRAIVPRLDIFGPEFHVAHSQVAKVRHLELLDLCHLLRRNGLGRLTGHSGPAASTATA